MLETRQNKKDSEQTKLVAHKLTRSANFRSLLDSAAEMYNFMPLRIRLGSGKAKLKRLRIWLRLFLSGLDGAKINTF
jgi:hypothetical protein